MMCDAPLTLWVNQALATVPDEALFSGLYIQTDEEAADAVEYIRRDVVDAWLELAARPISLQNVRR
jgi:hypothetical protein